MSERASREEEEEGGREEGMAVRVMHGVNMHGHCSTTKYARQWQEQYAQMSMHKSSGDVVHGRAWRQTGKRNHGGWRTLEVTYKRNRDVAVALASASRVSMTQRQTHESLRQYARRLKLFSPSKVNVFLRVTRRRDDGFHDLASLFQVINLGDELEVAIREDYVQRGGDEDESWRGGDLLSCNNKYVPLDSRNLVIKAFEEFRKMSGRKERFAAYLHKRVPAGAGLGGGSANASTAFYAVNELCDRVASEEQLQDWSGNVGSDCPVFFSHGAAFCTSRGEMVNDLRAPRIPLDADVPMLLVKPRIGLSTGKIFGALYIEGTSDADPERLLEELIKSGKCEQRLCVNDLEAPAFSQLPKLETLKQRLLGSCTKIWSNLFMYRILSHILSFDCMK